MPMDRSLYPENWNAIALAVKEAADWKCQECGRHCLKPGEDIEDFLYRISTGRFSECPVIEEFHLHPKRFEMSAAHLDHQPQNCDRANLKALCSVCHCRYDLRQMPRKKMLKRERLGQLNLLGGTNG